MNLDNYLSKTTLKGNPQQVKWAGQIRKKKADELKKLGLRGMALAVKPKLTEDNLKAMKLQTQAQAQRFLWFVCYQMFGNPDALWWISHRDDALWQWIEPAVHLEVARCSKKQLL